jgi:hypothetical protein
LYRDYKITIRTALKHHVLKKKIEMRTLVLSSAES